MRFATLYTPRQAAQKLGIGYSTLKTWILNGKIRTIRTVGGHHRLPERELDRFLCWADQRNNIQERSRNFRRIARTQLVGRVTDINFAGLVAQVTLSLGEQHVTSIVSADAIREMQLKKGQTAVALVRYTEVTILLP